MPHYGKCDVISGQNKKFKLKISKVEKNLYYSFKSSFIQCNKNFRFINTLMQSPGHGFNPESVSGYLYLHGTYLI